MIPLIKSTFFQESKTKQRLCSFIQHASKLSIGEECRKFEHNFSKFQGRRFTVFVNSGSSANLAIIQALFNLGYLRRGDTIGFSALTWSTNVMPIIQLGMNAVPVDVELDTLNISSNTFEKSIAKYNMKVLFITNLLGFCGDLDKICLICKKNNILLIEDNCESLGSEYKGKKLGNWGFGSTFSFYVGHHMSTIEGGAICTDDEELYTMLQLVRAHGWDRNLTEDRQEKIRIKHNVNSSFYSRYTFYDLGYNLRTTEIQGFLGNVQLKYIKEIIKKRQENFLFFAQHIYSNPSYYPIYYDHLDIVSNFAVPIICKTKQIRDKLVKKCDGLLEIRPVVGGDMTKQPFFSHYMKSFIQDNKTNASVIHGQGLYFGNNPELTEKEKRIIVRLFA